jgi:unsaturated rhamnogalacturonyl hydrolase
MKHLLLVACFCAVAGGLLAADRGTEVIALDGYHNNKKDYPDHYRWEGTDLGGYSQFGDIFRRDGAELRTTHAPFTSSSLAGLDVVIIVAPDLPTTAIDPKYISDSEVDALENWVRQGGRLVMFGNDKGHSEFEHLNRLASRFGVQFIETTYTNSEGKILFTVASTNPILGVGLSAFLDKIAPLKLSNSKASILLADGATPLMVLIPYGKGKVVALGDPWLYNEFIETNDNHRMAVNLAHMLRAP